MHACMHACVRAHAVAKLNPTFGDNQITPTAKDCAHMDE